MYLSQDVNKNTQGLHALGRISLSMCLHRHKLYKLMKSQKIRRTVFSTKRIAKVNNPTHKY